MDYKSMLDVIKDIENGVKVPDVSYVDISPILNSTSAPSTPYQSLLQIINSIESKGKGEYLIREKQKPPHLITSGLEQISYSQQKVGAAQTVEVPVQNVNPPENVPAAQPQAVQPQIENKKAKLELGSLIKKLGAAARKPSYKIKRVNISELVLPNLTLADQIAELERIIEGLKENVFDSEHIIIVEEELYGLDQMLSDLRKQNKLVPKSELEKSLFDLRDQRLSEALSLLHKVN
ncbi:MAG: hypothetical protein ACP5TL_00160 [Candidatus Micrarchaeia archaeon]